MALIWTFALSYLSPVVLLIWQALRAQSIVAPDALTLQVLAAIISAAALAILAIVMHARINAAIYEDVKSL